MRNQGDEGCDVWILRCGAGAGADVFVKEFGTEGAKCEHGLDVGGRCAVSVGVEGVWAVWTLHDSGCVTYVLMCC